VVRALKNLAFLAALALAAPVTHAAVYAWDVHAPVEFSGPSPVPVGPGIFVDYWTFTVAQAAVIETSVVVANNNLPSFNIAPGSTYALYSFGLNGAFDAGGPDDVLVDGTGWGFDGTTGATQHPVSLSAGGYYFRVSGDATGTAGGRYQITSTLAPVPLPGGAGLAAAGFGLLGLLARRRRPASGEAGK
jgi:hypothetical protein